MDVRPIRNERDLDWALSEVAAYFRQMPQLGSADADRFDVLSTLIEAYETRVHPVPRADPRAVLAFAIEELGRTQSELAAILGSRSRASEVLSGRRRLTVEMIRAISAAWRIPADALMGEAKTAAAA